MKRKTFPRPLTWLLAVLLAAALASCAGSQRKDDESRQEGELHLQMGINHLLKGNLELAYFELTKAEKLLPRNPDVHFALGTVYLNRKEPERAIESFRRTLSLNSSHSDAMNNMGFAYSMLERWDDAILYAQKALDQLGYQTPEKALTIIGWAYYKKGDAGKAVDYLNRARDIRPGMPDTENKMATIYLEQGRLDKAKVILRDLVKKVPGFARARLNMGVVYYREKDLRAAKREFKAVLDLVEGDSEEARLAKGYLDLIE